MEPRVDWFEGLLRQPFNTSAVFLMVPTPVGLDLNAGWKASLPVWRTGDRSHSLASAFCFLRRTSAFPCMNLSLWTERRILRRNVTALRTYVEVVVECRPMLLVLFDQCNRGTTRLIHCRPFDLKIKYLHVISARKFVVAHTVGSLQFVFTAPAQGYACARLFTVSLTLNVFNWQIGCVYRADHTPSFQDPGDGTLSSALSEFTSPEILDGENKYFCNICRR